MGWLIQKTTLVVLFSMFYSHCSVGQNQDKHADNPIYNWFDGHIGLESSNLYNGVQYINEYVIFGKSHQFFGTDTFVKGEVLYDNHLFTSTDVKYDLFNDDLILAPFGSSGSFPFILVKSKVKSFSIGQSHFVNVTEIIDERAEKDVGYCELIWKSDRIQSFRKISKTKHKKFRQGRVNYEFIPKYGFYLVYKRNLYPANDKADWISLFPDYRLTIKTFFQSNKKQLKSAPLTFYKRLSIQIDKLLKEPLLIDEN